MSYRSDVDNLMAYSILQHACQHLEADYDRNRDAMDHSEAICNFGARAQMLELMDVIHGEVTSGMSTGIPAMPR